MNKYYKYLITFLVIIINLLPNNELWSTNLPVNNEWQLYSSINGIEIYFKYSPCQLEMGYDQEWVLLKFVNTTSTSKMIEYNKIMEIDGVCVTCNDPNGEYRMSVTLQANEVVQGTCTVNDNRAHHIYSKTIEVGANIPDTLTRFELGSLMITDL